MIEFTTTDEFIDEFYIDAECLIDRDKTKITKDAIIGALLPYTYYWHDYIINYKTLTINNVIENFYDDPKTTFDIKTNRIRRIYWDSWGCFVAFLMKDNTVYEVTFDTHNGVDYSTVKETSIDDKIEEMVRDDMELYMEREYFRSLREQEEEE